MSDESEPLGQSIWDTADFLRSASSPQLQSMVRMQREAEAAQRQMRETRRIADEIIEAKQLRAAQAAKRDAAILDMSEHLQAMQQLIGMLVQRTEQQAEDAKRQHRVNIILGFVASTSGAATLFALNAPWKAWIAVMIGAAIVAIVWVLSSRPSTDQG